MMRGYSVIPKKIERTEIISGIDFTVDTKGLNCIIKPSGGGIMIFLEPGGMAFPIKEGESFDFCGKIYYRHNSGSPVVNCLYYSTL